MSNEKLNELISKKDITTIINQYITNIDNSISIVDLDGTVLIEPKSGESAIKVPILLNNEDIGWVYGGKHAPLLALTLSHAAKMEFVNDDLADEVLLRYKEISMMYNFFEKITKDLTQSDVIKTILNEADKIENADRGSIMFLNEKTGMFNIVAGFGVDKVNFFLHKGEGIAGSIFDSGKAEIVNNAPCDKRFISGISNIRSMMCAPLKTGNKTFGVITISSEKKVHYTAANLKIFEAIALQGAIAIENTQYLEELNKHRQHLEVLVKERTNDLAKKNVLLQKKIAEIKVLQGFLPICAGCKKIRNDSGFWEGIEQYISEHSDTVFSHGLCPDCTRELYPELADKLLKSKEKK